MADVNLSLLFEGAFGYKSSAFEPDFAPVPVMDSANGTGQLRKEFGSVAGARMYAPDARGREYFLPVTIGYVDAGGVQREWDLPYPVVQVRGQKRIITTELTERSGTVKELINTGDYEIVIRGVIIEPTNELPEQDLIMLRTIYENGQAVVVKNAVTDVFLVGNEFMAVIRSLTDTPVKGVKNVRAYEMLLTSDAPFNLEEI